MYKSEKKIEDEFINELNNSKSMTGKQMNAYMDKLSRFVDNEVSLPSSYNYFQSLNIGNYQRGDYYNNNTPTYNNKTTYEFWNGNPNSPNKLMNKDKALKLTKQIKSDTKSDWKYKIDDVQFKDKYAMSHQYMNNIEAKFNISKQEKRLNHMKKELPSFANFVYSKKDLDFSHYDRNSFSNKISNQTTNSVKTKHIQHNTLSKSNKHKLAIKRHQGLQR